MSRQLIESRPRRRIARLLARSVAAAFVLTLLAGAIGLRYWTDPTTVRRLVLDRLRIQFPGAEVSVDSAILWPGWGIAVTNLTLCRRGDPTLTPVLQVPSGRIEHDPEQLSQGKLRIRRVKLDRARITAVRRADGTWNLDGMIAPPTPGTPIPILVLERGTLVVRAATPAGGETSWELGGLRASLVDNPPGLAKFEARADAARLGPGQLEGTWRRDRGHVDLTLDLFSIPLTMDLLREVSRFAPGQIDSVRHCTGEIRVHLDARRRPDEGPGWQPEWNINLTKGRLGIRELPLDLAAVEVTARLSGNRLIVKEATAMAADAPVRATAELRLGGGDPLDSLERATATIDRLLVTPELFARMPEKAQRFQQRFAPVGRASLDCRYARRTTGGWNARVEVRPEGLAARYHKFPYPLRQVRGSVVNEFADNHAGRHEIDISAEVNGGARVAFRGTVAGEEPLPEVDLRITGVDGGPACNIPLDDDLIAALPPKFQPLARSFHFRGLGNLTARIHHAAGQSQGHDQYYASCRDAAVTYDAFPVPLDNVAAELEIHLGPGLPGDPNRGDHWKLSNATGMHRGGRVAITAHDEPAPHGKRLVIDIGGQRVPLGDALAEALAKYRLRSVWEMLAPSGQFDFGSLVILTDQPSGPPTPDIKLHCRGATLRPAFFPYTMTDLSASLHHVAGRTILGECGARHGATKLRLASGEIRTREGLYLDIRDILAGPLAPDVDLLLALPPSFQRACAVLKPFGSCGVEVKRLLLIDPPAAPTPGPPVLHWDGSIAFNDAGFTTGVPWTGLVGMIACRGTARGNRLEWLAGHASLDTANVLGQPIGKLHARMNVDPATPEVLEVRNIRGQIFGGILTGEGRVTFGSGLDFALDAKALGIQLEEFGRHNHFGEGRLSGRSTALLYLTGKGTGIEELAGRAEIDVPQGRLYDLPLVLELFKAVSLRGLDGVAFDEAHAAVKIQGRRLVVERLDLLGSAVSLGGRGGLDIDGGNVDLDFYAVWARIAQVLPAAWKDLPASLSSNLLKIKMRGSLGKPSFAPEPVPFLVEPVQQLLERTKTRMN